MYKKHKQSWSLDYKCQYFCFEVGCYPFNQTKDNYSTIYATTDQYLFKTITYKVKCFRLFNYYINIGLAITSANLAKEINLVRSKNIDKAKSVYAKGMTYQEQLEAKAFYDECQKSEEELISTIKRIN